MLYILIRLILSAILVLIVLQVLKKSTCSKRKVIAILTSSWLVFMLLFSVFPADLLMLRFSSPEQAYAYNHTDEVHTVIHGNSSSLVVSGGNTEYNFTVLRKDEHGWIAGNNLDSSVIYQGIVDDSASVLVLKDQTKTDYYTVVLPASQSAEKPSDNCGTVFLPLDGGALYVAWVDRMSTNYILSINGSQTVIPTA